MNRILLAFLITSIAACSPSHTDFQTALNNDEITQIDDMLVPTEWVAESSQELTSKGFTQKTARRWTDGIIRYQFGSGISSYEQQQFLGWCQEMGEYAKVQCLPKRSSDRDYIMITKTSENICGSSFVGRFGGEQPLKIRCWVRRTVQHELLHAFGLPHEHNRHDRDDYIQMVWENLDPRLGSYFKKVNIDSVSLYLRSYDYDSVLHYESRAGSKNGLPVFYRKDRPGATVNLKDRMSFGDHYTLYAMYGGQPPRR